MVHRRFPHLFVFRRTRATEDGGPVPSDGIAAASWADAFRTEHADLVGEPPTVRPRRHRWLVVASLLGLVGMAAWLHGDLRPAGSGARRGVEGDQRRTAIAEAVAQELVRTREAFEAYRVQATRDLTTVRDSLAARENAVHEAEQARQRADDLAIDRAHTVAVMTSDLAAARREVAEAQAALTQARVAAREAAEAAQAMTRRETALREAALPSPHPIAAAKEPRDLVPVRAEGRAEAPARLAMAESGLDAGRGLRFGRSDMAWLPLAETAFMALDTGPARTEAAPVAAPSRGPACLDALPTVLRSPSPPVPGKGARRTKAETAAPAQTRQRAGSKPAPSQIRGAGARQRPAPDPGADLLTGEGPASLPGRS